MFKSERGQTLIEIMIAAGILVAISALAAMITARVYNSYEVIKAENEARKTLEETLNTIAYGDTKGLIDAKSIHTDVSYQINSQDFTFVEKTTDHYIRYVYDSGSSTLRRKEYDTLANFNADSPTLNTDLDITGSVDFYPAVSFKYFTNDETEITTVSSSNVNQITRVKLTMTIRVPVGNSYRILTFYTSVRPLNLYIL